MTYAFKYSCDKLQHYVHINDAKNVALLRIYFKCLVYQTQHPQLIYRLINLVLLKFCDFKMKL